MSFLKNSYEKTNFSRYFQKTTIRLKIDLGDKPNKMWVKKSEFNCLVSFTCFRTCETSSWYFDSGCSRHMIGDKSIFMDYKPLSEGLVTFGDGVTVRVPLILLIFMVFHDLKTFCMLMVLWLI